MMFRLACGQLLAPACLLAALSLSGRPSRRRADLGPESRSPSRPTAVGKLRVTPVRRPVSTPVAVTGEGFRQPEPNWSGVP